jgi:hypothetical protein
MRCPRLGPLQWRRPTRTSSTPAPTKRGSEDSLNCPIRLDGKLAVLASTVESSDSVPIQNAFQVFKSLSGRLDSVLAKWKDIHDKDLASLNEMARKENIPLLTLRPGQANSPRIEGCSASSPSKLVT